MQSIKASAIPVMSNPDQHISFCSNDSGLTLAETTIASHVQTQGRQRRQGYPGRQQTGTARQFGVTCGAVAVNVLQRLDGSLDWFYRNIDDSVDAAPVFEKYRQLFQPCQKCHELLTTHEIIDLCQLNNFSAKCMNKDLFFSEVPNAWIDNKKK